MFSMGRDRRMPLGSLWGKVSSRFKTPANASVAVGVLAALPFVLTDSPIVLAAGATGLIYLSYLMCNIGVLAARTRGWPRQGAWFKLGSWGAIINALPIVWGGPAGRAARPARRGDAARPGAGGSRLDPDRAERRDHEPQLPRYDRRSRRSLRYPAGRQRHASARDQPRGRARRDRRRGRGRRR